jgi:tagatose-6-phosphate ketose/aldose isomerase
VQWTLSKLLSLESAEKARLGVVHTPGEIDQQPNAWLETAELVRHKAEELRHLLEGVQSIVISGAGTSHYVGVSVQSLLRKRLSCNVEAIATTDIVADPLGTLPASTPSLLVSVARSGNSPESVAAVQLADQLRPSTRHLVITCNRQGKLAQWAETLGDRGLALILPEQTNDKGLAMTSSYTSLVVACQALGFLNELAEYEAMVHRAAEAGRDFLSGDADRVAEISALPFKRVVFLGNGPLRGAAVESHLKLLEMSAGQVMCQAETSMGLRHGPMTFIDEETLVVHFLSGDPYTAKYERDILEEIRVKELGLSTVVVGEAAEVEAVKADYALKASASSTLEDGFRPQVHVMIGQLLGLFKSLELSLSPDAPSRKGVIHRVVRGVQIYPWQE